MSNKETEREARELTPRGVWFNGDQPVSCGPGDVLQFAHDTRTGKFRVRVLADADPRLTNPAATEPSLDDTETRHSIYVARWLRNPAFRKALRQAGIARNRSKP